MTYKESDCVGCEHCINCGRHEGYYVYACDKCGAETTDKEEIINVNGFDYCQSCYDDMYGDDLK